MTPPIIQTPVKILGLGHHSPSRSVPSAEIDQLAGLTPGTTLNTTGIRQRFWISESESQAGMGAQALQKALLSANLSIQDIDCIVSANGTMCRILPCTASTIQRELGEDTRGIPCFDIDATCLSFICALNLMSTALAAGQYQRVAIVSTEVASPGINLNHIGSAGLFGDGAAACILGRPDNKKHGIAGFHMETDAHYNDCCAIPGGGSNLHAKYYTPETASEYLFQMDGPLLLKRTLKTIGPFLKKLYQKTGMNQEDIDYVIPHQASPAGMKMVRRNLKFPESRWHSIVRDYGNCVAASIPMALSMAHRDRAVREGDTVLLLGSGAGLSLAAAILVL